VFGAAEYTSVGETLRAVGKIAIDETRVVRVHPKIEGWIEHVYVDFMGAPVKKGDPLVTVYSPEMLASQKEYLLAIKAREVMQDGDGIVQASRKRLELWDLSAAQIEELETTRKPIQSITIYSPAAGFITARNSFASQRITPESELYAISDLSRVWVMADLFENDIAKIRVGQPAMVKMPYANGGEFLARVDNVQPQVDPQTRTVKARLEVSNPAMRLRPDMFVDVEFTIGGSRQLTVPADAVLNAGSRQTVFVDRGNGNLEPRAVETGDQIDDRIVITHGLKEGERIVTSANFLIDSESQLKNK
jgi:RND family efflux transporter MFP subunit